MRWSLLIAAISISLPASASAAPAPADPLFGSQWGIQRIRATEAWDFTRGAGVTIAVVDSGIDARHPDLAGKVDLALAWDHVGNDADPNDQHGHGTHVAGIAAAATGNGIGIAGVAPDARVLPIRVLDAGNAGTAAGIAAGIIRAADAGAEVINLSLGSLTSPAGGLMDAAVTYALARGAVVVGISHNQSQPFCHAPAFVNPAVLCVGATDGSDNVAGFSNYGARLDLSAPGAGVLSSLPGGGYASWSGTSMAAPHVSGVAALLVSLGATNVEAGLILRLSARDAGAAGYDTFYGWGILDAAAAVAMCREVCLGG